MHHLLPELRQVEQKIICVYVQIHCFDFLILFNLKPFKMPPLIPFELFKYQKDLQF